MYSNILMGIIGVTMAFNGLTIDRPITWAMFFFILSYGVAKYQEGEKSAKN